jgi:hypothetical protein
MEQVLAALIEAIFVAMGAPDTCRKPPSYVPYKGTYVPYASTFGAPDQGQTLDV